MALGETPLGDRGRQKPADRPFASPAEQLGRVRIGSDFLGVSDVGALVIDGCAAPDLIDEFGSPLFVAVERTLRANYRRIHDAFQSRWSAFTNVLYAIKANNNLALRAILQQEGAGCDCFGLGELYATFLGGADPSRVVLNGSNKSAQELRKAVELGVAINVDAEDEIDYLRTILSGTEQQAVINLRLKVAPPELESLETDYMALAVGHSLREHILDKKWGLSVERALELMKEVKKTPAIRLRGFSVHVGRLSASPGAHQLMARGVVSVLDEIFQASAFTPEVLDVGGGFARERDPESRALELNPNTIEDYADAITKPLSTWFREVDRALPELWIEPGRYLVGNALVLLTTVGVVRRDHGRVWVNVDVSTNSLARIDTSGSQHHVIAAIGMRRPHIQVPQIVGPTCTPSVLSTQNPMPDLVRGDLVAILDAGMYAEVMSNQFNGIPRPATVLVLDGRAELIKERETIQDVFAKHRIPERLRLVHPSI